MPVKEIELIETKLRPLNPLEEINHDIQEFEISCLSSLSQTNKEIYFKLKENLQATQQNLINADLNIQNAAIEALEIFFIKMKILNKSIAIQKEYPFLSNVLKTVELETAYNDYVQNPNSTHLASFTHNCINKLRIISSATLRALSNLEDKLENYGKNLATSAASSFDYEQISQCASTIITARDEFYDFAKNLEPHDGLQTLKQYFQKNKQLNATVTKTIERTESKLSEKIKQDKQWCEWKENMAITLSFAFIIPTCGLSLIAGSIYFLFYHNRDLDSLKTSHKFVEGIKQKSGL